MELFHKFQAIKNIAVKDGQRLRESCFDYWGVEVVYSSDRWHVILPFILNVSIGPDGFKFHVGDEHIFNCLFKKIYPQE